MYNKCEESTNGDSYVKVESTHLYIYTGTNKIVRGLVVDYEVTGKGVVTSNFQNNTEGGCDPDGCDGISIPNKGHIAFGVYNIDLADAMLLYTTQSAYMIYGHSRTSSYYSYANIGWIGREVLSALFIRAILASPGEPRVGDELTIAANIYNYCKYKAAQRFTVTTYDSNGNVYHPPTNYVMWINGETIEQRVVPQKYIFEEKGQYTIEFKTPNGEKWSMNIDIAEEQQPQPPEITLDEVWLECESYEHKDEYHSCAGETYYGGETIESRDWIRFTYYGTFKNTGGPGSKKYLITASNCDFGQDVQEKEVTVVWDEDDPVEKHIPISNVFYDVEEYGDSMEVCINTSDESIRCLSLEVISFPYGELDTVNTFLVVDGERIAPGEHEIVKEANVEYNAMVTNTGDVGKIKIVLVDELDGELYNKEFNLDAGESATWNGTFKITKTRKLKFSARHYNSSLNKWIEDTTKGC